VARLILLNGAPGVGQSTMAGRYAAEHPGTQWLDRDVRRTMVGGWADDYAGTGALIRPAALGLITAYLRESGDVVLPQLIARESELARFERAATDGGGAFVHVHLDADPAAAVARFEGRERDRPHLDAVHTTVAAQGGTVPVITHYHQALQDLRAQRGDVITVDASGPPDSTYLALVAVLA
jgi:predicted kinase